MVNTNTFFLLVLIAFISTIKNGKYIMLNVLRRDSFKVWFFFMLNKQFFIYVVQL